MDINIGYSPCPNDTFIFYALVHGKVNTGKYRFQPFLADVETLNELAGNHQLPVTKLSFNAFLSLTDQYYLLQSGGALGRNCGPLLIGKPPVDEASIGDERIAIPGTQTTANFLLDFYRPGLDPTQKLVLTFDQIEEAVLKRKVNAGVIIHENRFTYQDKGLCLIQDLGAYWESKTGSPIPLGGIVASRSLGPGLIRRIEKAIKESLQYAWAHPEEAMTYVRAHAQAMEDHVMRQHIDLYVNEHSADLGPEGRRAINRFFQEAKSMGRVNNYKVEFLDD